ncbi:MAG: UDP-3-O-(3-hydroxymyristoyl)glucosamine N-acyltransferase [Proteobacteria bacterium]|nr:UDP-3-O-(3-hydroxymyristoyl)glucosamine N-acyltransferase [Pseudomonadota bacterium]
MKKIYTLVELANQLNGELCNVQSAELPVQSLASLSYASHNDLSYFEDEPMLFLLKETKAAAVLLKKEYLRYCPVAAIVVDQPYAAMQVAAKLIEQNSQEKAWNGIHPTACIHPSVSLGKNVSIGAHTVINEDVLIGDNVCIGSNCLIDRAVKIGAECKIDNSVVLYPNTILESLVNLQSGVIIGASPFNSIKQHGRWHSETVVGNVYIADSVQIGANTVIVRGTLKDTFIAEGVQIDNLVQIAHDVQVGAYSAIAGCAAIGANTKIGNHCIIGGASTIAANVVLSDDVVITGMSTVNKSLLKQGIYSSGTIVSEHQRWRRNAARFKRLDDFITRLCRIEKRSK